MSTSVESHHDAHSFIFSAILEAQRLKQHLPHGNYRARSAADAVLESLEILEACVKSLKYASNEFVTSFDVRSVDLKEALREAIRRFNGFEGVDIRLELPENKIFAMVAGGNTGFQRLITNLMRNACEGDGRLSSTTVLIQVMKSSHDRILLSIHDNGPGFSNDPILGVPTTTKSGGTGVGLRSVIRIVEASNGSCSFGVSPLGGALVNLEFPINIPEISYLNFNKPEDVTQNIPDG